MGSFFFLGYENDSVEDLKEMASSASSRKRGKRRYFWEYSEQLTPSQQERILRPSEWNRDTLPSNMYQRNGLHHGKRGSEIFSAHFSFLGGGSIFYFEPLRWGFGM